MTWLFKTVPVRYIFLAEKAKKDAASIVNALENSKIKLCTSKV